MSEKKYQDLFRKTFLWILLMFGGIIFAVHMTVYFLFPVFYTHSLQQDLSNDAAVIREMLEESTQTEGRTFLRTYAKQNHLDVLASFDGEKISYQEGQITIENLLDTDGEELKIEKNEEVERILIEREEVTLADGTAAEIQLMVSTAPVREARQITLRLLPLTVLFSLLISFGFSYLYSRKVTKPVMEMLSATKEMKVDFLRSASHDLKTPLASLRILLENMLFHVGKYKNHEKYLEEAIGQVDQLTDMVREILEASRLQEICLEKSDITVGPQIRQMLDEQKMQIQRKEIQVEVKVTDTLRIEMNDELFGNIFGNLLENAVKYCSERGQISVCQEGSMLWIRNSCTPLEEEELEQIFEAFYRPEYSRHSHAEGNGLGLYIVREGLKLSGIPYEFVPEEQGMCFQLDLHAVQK